MPRPVPVTGMLSNVLPAVALQIEKQSGIIVLALGRNLLTETTCSSTLEPVLKLAVLPFFRDDGIDRVQNLVNHLRPRLMTIGAASSSPSQSYMRPAAGERPCILGMAACCNAQNNAGSFLSPVIPAHRSTMLPTFGAGEPAAHRQFHQFDRLGALHRSQRADPSAVRWSPSGQTHQSLNLWEREFHRDRAQLAGSVMKPYRQANHRIGSMPVGSAIPAAACSRSDR